MLRAREKPTITHMKKDSLEKQIGAAVLRRWRGYTHTCTMINSYYIVGTNRYTFLGWFI